MTMVGKVRRQAVIVIAVASLGIAALTGCTSGTPTPQRTVLTTKSAGAYYLATTCKANAAADGFSNALSAAETSTSETGPDLDNLKAASLAFEKAVRAAAARLGNPKVVWPTSIRKSVLVLRNQYRSELSTLSKMATSKQMSDEAADYGDFPDTTKAAGASKLIRSTLGLPADASSSCSTPGSTPTTSSVAPATGMLIKGGGGGYTFRVPVGWTIPRDAPQADAYAISAKPDAAGVYDTVNVLPAPATGDTLDQIEQNGVSYLEQVMGATHVQVRPHVMVAGVERVHISSQRTQNGITEWNEQYILQHSGIAFTVTFAFTASEPQAEREALAESVLATWTWT
jgi:hypothetical protein